MNDAVRLVHRFDAPVISSSGDPYAALVFASERTDGHWDGWIVFLPIAGGRALPTDRETTQRDLRTMAYWASGLGAVYLEGALQRALDLMPEAKLHRRAIALAREETMARAEADAYERAADAAHEHADRAAALQEVARAILEKLAHGAPR